jgi:DNA excision repair protein ERCC-4
MTNKIKNIVILIDTREQLPLKFPPDLPIERSTLVTGDYSIIWNGADLRNYTVVERKSVGDLLNCIGRDRARFQRELARLAEIPHRYLVVEGTLRELLEHPLCRIHPNAILGSLMAWSVKYRLAPIFAGDRTHAAAVVYALLRHAARYAQGSTPARVPSCRGVEDAGSSR